METNAPARVARAQRAQLLHGIYAILNESPRAVELARAVLDAGVRVVQYRAKAGIRAGTLQALRALTRERDALLILNDDWRSALAFDCDGVHLGPGDDGFERPAPVREALRDRLIGLSCGDAGEIRRAGGAELDYLGIGSVFATASKADAGEPISIEGLRELAAASALPVAAIGGIGAENLAQVRRTGVAMAAVLSAIADAPHPGRCARELVALWAGS